MTTEPKPYTYRIIRSAKRRTVAIHIKANEVTVRAPTTLALAVIHRFVDQRHDWILKTLAKDRSQPVVNFQDGALLPIGGKLTRMVLVTGSSGDIKLGGDVLIIPVSNRVKYPHRYALKQLDTWLERRATAVLSEQVFSAANSIDCGSRLTRITYKVTRSKWGHCTHAGVIQLHPRIMMAPPEIQHYLVAHEVAHLRHMNHSGAFWETVARLDPSYKAHRQWLKDHQHATLLLSASD